MLHIINIFNYKIVCIFVRSIGELASIFDKTTTPSLRQHVHKS